MIYQWVVFHFHPLKSQRLSSLWPQSTQKHQSPLFHPNEWREVVCDFNPSTKLVISFIISPSFGLNTTNPSTTTPSANRGWSLGFVSLVFRCANSGFLKHQDASYFVSHKHWWVQERCKSCPAPCGKPMGFFVGCKIGESFSVTNPNCPWLDYDEAQ